MGRGVEDIHAHNAVDDSDANNKKLSVFDTGENRFVYENEPLKDAEPYLFEGMKLTLFDWDDLDLYEDESGWTTGACNYIYQLRVQGKRYPSDYEIRFFAQNVSTSINNIDVPFEIWNVTTGTKIEAILSASR